MKEEQGQKERVIRTREEIEEQEQWYRDMMRWLDEQKTLEF